MSRAVVLEAFKKVQKGKLSLPTISNIDLTKSRGKTRPNSISIEDALFGDSGKGAVVAKIIHALKVKKKKVLTLRWNGGANAGHETKFKGKIVTTSQLPTGVIFENTIAVMSRGMLIHPEDLVTEIGNVTYDLNTPPPGILVIDEATTLSLDIHRAWETVLNSQFEGGKGSTSRGIATGYSTFYERHPLIVKDLLDANWEEKFRKHYQFYQTQIEGYKATEFDFHLEDIDVTSLADKSKGESKIKRRKVGSEQQFINRLAAIRDTIKKYTLSSIDVYNLVHEAWNNDTAVVLEGAQGIGLDPWHGIYPDVTSSRPASRNINDATYNIILPEQLRVRSAVMKTLYMSSVGTRKLPYIISANRDEWVKTVRDENDERGRVSGRDRDIYEPSIPLLQAYKIAAGFDSLVATHMDAAKPGEPFDVVAYYTYKGTDTEAPYLPYQDHLDKLEAHTITFEGWDPKSIIQAKSITDYDPRALIYLSFLQKTVAPLSFITYGADLDEYHSCVIGF